MGEFMTALKLFFCSMLIVAVLGLNVGKMTIEEHIQSAFQHSLIAKPLQKVVDGAAAAIRTGMASATQYANQAVSGPEPQKASRINFNVERSESAQLVQKARAAKAAAQSAADAADDD